MSFLMIGRQSTESTSEEEDSETQLSVMISSVDEIMESERPAFCLNEEQRKLKTFHERKTDLDAAIKWIVKEIVSA